ncbi:DUF2846 domain-containing protein|uniref:DUF2846 domain-containing protein n=1 Tax=Noviherbaspirillum sp. L7-7A TaxID=2850560 RepID=UPI001C2C0B6E|nr:DUF2846 domain-containing protein [Noviherbaspirillum sp. L7-7A]MBV0880537.1 DUF2846 domain-containing protein [Noviherbaspirillum sp. L7-7A]
MIFLHSKLIHYGFLLTLAAGLAVFSCDRVEGPLFPGLSAVAPEMAQVYLYRRDAMAAYAQGFDVIIDGKICGQLSNASYLRLSLAPGRHLLEVAPGPRAAVIEAKVDAQPGKNMFFEFVFSTGLDMQPLFHDALIANREEREAMLTLPKLREKALYLVQGAK